MSSTPIGKTKSQGWEIGVRRSFPINVDQAWELLVTPPGLEYWLGEGEIDFKKGQSYEMEDGTKGEIRSYTEGSLIRMTWQPPRWDFASTLQIRVSSAKKGSTISVHHEKLENGEQREEMRSHWTAVFDKLGKLIKE
jgi:uncharacterized protein YndB with AHSA1/START domain